MKTRTRSPKPNLKALQEKWPSPYVAREEVGRFSGGVLNPRTLANFDSLNKLIIKCLAFHSNF